MHDIPLNDTQRIFAEKNHNLVYKFLHEKNLPASEYYDIVIFGYLRAVQRYLTDPNLAGYSFATVAWRAMEGEVVNTHRTDKRRFRVIRFVRSRQSYTGHLTRRSTPTVTDEEALHESEVALLLHALAKRVTPDERDRADAEYLAVSCEHAAGQCTVHRGGTMQRFLKGGNDRMKKRKLELYITGKLMSALMVGRPAIFSTGGEMYHTAPVVKIHETETQEIHFETSTTHYYIKPRPFVLAVLNPRRQTLAACA